MIKKILKKLIFSFMIIYGIDIILRGFDVFVPINYYTVGIVFILGFPGLIMLALSFFFIL